MTRRLTFSKLALADQCPPSMVLPPTPSTSGAATTGLVLHQLLQDVRNLSEEEAIGRVPPAWREAAHDWEFRGLPTDAGAWAGEVAYALDVDRLAARELGRDLGRQYDAAGAQPHEVVGAADAVALAGEHAVIVGDLKTGYAWVPPPRDNLQIRGLVAAAQLAYRRDEGQGIIWHRRLDGSGWTERATFDAIDQAETLDHLRGLRERIERAQVDLIAGRRLDVRPSGACATCDALPSCPAKRDMVIDLVVDQEEALVEMFRASLTAEGGAAAAFHRLEAIDAVSARMRKVLDEYATQHPIDLGGGRRLGPVVSERESLLGNVAFHVIKDLYDEETAWKAADVKVTKTGEHSVEAAVKHVIATRGQPMEQGKKGPKKVPRSKLEEALLDKIRDAKGARVKRTETVKVFSVKGE